VILVGPHDEALAEIHRRRIETVARRGGAKADEIARRLHIEILLGRRPTV
jgi:hypothetical protein